MSQRLSIWQCCLDQHPSCFRGSDKWYPLEYAQWVCVRLFGWHPYLRQQVPSLYFPLPQALHVERKYDVVNRELLTIMVALEEWRHWLEGASQPFLVWTDHKNLEYLRTAKQLNSRQESWALFFNQFHFTLSAFSCSWKKQIIPHRWQCSSPQSTDSSR